jgi:hypothetical protein
MNTRAKGIRRFPTLAVLIVGVVAALLVAYHGWAGKGRSSGSAIGAQELASVEKQLRSTSGIYLHPLPAATPVGVSASAAEATALTEFGRPVTSKVSAVAVLDTDKAWTKRGPNGAIRLQISNRPVWVVLLPHFSMMGYHGMTLCVFVDAVTGHYLTAATINLR